jgi:glycosyltransferase involved in cell wall biosynthesis
MPIIVSNAISTTDEIKENKCGIVISYNQKEFINAVVKLLTNEKLLLAYRKNALIFVEQFDYNNIYGKSFKRILSKNGKN